MYFLFISILFYYASITLSLFSTLSLKLPISLSTTVEITIAPFTFTAVRPISIIESIGNTIATGSNGSPIPPSTTVAAI